MRWNERLYILRDHKSPTPWADAFATLEHKEELEREAEGSGRVGKLLNWSRK